jgi:Cd2+/Zn2+-exporting ATPase/Cu+-exporting ATPase
MVVDNRHHLEKVELHVRGLDCADCARHVQAAIETVPGVTKVEVLIAAQKAVVVFDPEVTGEAKIRRAVEGAGYAIHREEEGKTLEPLAGFSRKVLTLFGAVFGAVLFVVVVGEWLGLFKQVTHGVPWPVWLVVILAGGWPVRSLVHLFPYFF